MGNGCVAGDLALEQGARRENILYGSLTDEQRRCSGKDLQPCGLRSGEPLAALLLSHRAHWLCLLRRALPAARRSLAHSFPICEMGSGALVREAKYNLGRSLPIADGGQDASLVRRHWPSHPGWRGRWPQSKISFFWLRPQSSDNSYRWLHPAQEPQRLVEEQLELELFSSMQASYSQFLTSINSAYLKKNIKKKC